MINLRYFTVKNVIMHKIRFYSNLYNLNLNHNNNKINNNNFNINNNNKNKFENIIILE